MKDALFKRACEQCGITYLLGDIRVIAGEWMCPDCAAKLLDSLLALEEYLEGKPDEEPAKAPTQLRLDV